MNDRLFFSSKCVSCERFEDTSSSNNTIMEIKEESKPRCDNGRNELCQVDVSETEQRILSWLQENQITLAIPEEKEMQYYEQKKSLVLKSKKSSLILQESPLMQRRRGSTSSLHTKTNERKSSDIFTVSPIKLSKFNTSKYLEISFKDFQDSQ